MPAFEIEQAKIIKWVQKNLEVSDVFPDHLDEYVHESAFEEREIDDWFDKDELDQWAEDNNYIKDPDIDHDAAYLIKEK